MSEVEIDGPLDYHPYGRDVTCWRWFLNGHEIVVEITGTAMEAEESALSPRVAEARRTFGESEVLRMLEWDIPNPRVVLSTDDD